MTVTLQPAAGVGSTDSEVEVSTSTFVLFICYFVGFFQFCYRLSDRAVTLLLVFLLTWMVTLDPISWK